MSRRRLGSAVIVALVGVLIALVYALRVLAPWGFDPTILVALGEKSTLQTDYARRLLGDVVTRPESGHDGKFFFAQANDPLFLEPQEHAVVLDRPIYRGQRMLYPLIAGGGGLFSPSVVIWSLLVVNLLAFGAGAYATARLAMLAGGSPWLGLFFPLNIGMLGEIDIDGAGVLALAFGVTAIWFVYANRLVAAATALTGAILAREVMLGMAVGLAIGVWDKRRQFKPWLVIPGVLVAAAWNLYLRSRVAELPAVGDAREIATYPFEGILQAIPAWFADGITSVVIGFFILLLILGFTIRGLIDRSILAWAALPFAALAAVLSVFVWLKPMDIARGVAPILTLYPVLLMLQWARVRQPDQ